MPVVKMVSREAPEKLPEVLKDGVTGGLQSSRRLLLVSSASSGLVSLTASAFGLVKVGLVGDLQGKLLRGK